MGLVCDVDGKSKSAWFVCFGISVRDLAPAVVFVCDVMNGLRFVCVCGGEEGVVLCLEACCLSVLNLGSVFACVTDVFEDM